MFVVKDLISVIERTVLAEGFGYCGIEKMGRTGTLSIHAKNGVFIAVCSHLKVNKSLDECFLEMQKALIKFKGKYGVFPRIYSQGASQGMRLPDWFGSWLEQEGIQIVLKTEEEIILEAHRAGVRFEDIKNHF